MGIITLGGLQFKSYHGVYPEEQKNGNTFIVDVTVETDLSNSAQSDELDDTVDYVELYKIIQQEMDQPSKLLEHVCERINLRLIEYIDKGEIETTIKKMNPPIGGHCDFTAVTLKTEKK